MPDTLALLGGQPVRTKPFPTWPVWGKEEERSLIEALNSGKWGKIDGDQAAKFEKRFASMHGCKFGIGVCNGTISLRIALMAAGIQAGDEVIVPPYTFLATATAVVEANAVPIFVDIDRETFNIDPKAIEKAITPKTRAIIPVHLGGIPCDMDAIMAIARKHNLIVIEDAAHAHAASYKGRPVGSIGHIGSFSFQSSKNLTSGEGGIIVTNDEKLAEKCRSIHNCGRIPGGVWYEHHVISGNYRLGELQAALLNAQIERLEEQTNTRDQNGKYLDEKLSQIPGITPQKRTTDTTRGAYHLYCYRFDQQAWGISRKRYLEALNKEGIPGIAGYVIPLYKQPLFVQKNFGPYSGANKPGLDYGKLHQENVEAITGHEGNWFTQNVMLGTLQDMEDIVAAIQKVYDNRHALSEQREAVGAAR